MMTDARGVRAHWGAAAVVAPAAAATLALATGWALQHDPTPAKPLAPGAPAAAAALAEAPNHPQRVDLTLHARAVAERARVVTLQRRLARLRTRLDAVRKAPVPSWRAFSGGAISGGTGAVRGSSSGGGSVSVPAPPHLSAPAPAPAAHASTGGS